MNFKENTLNEDFFWNDQALIYSYCKSLLSFFGKENLKIKILLGDYDSTPMVSHNGSDTYGVCIPRLAFSYKDENKKNEDIFLRKVFLKHELSHVLFTPMSDLYNDHISSRSFGDSNIQGLYNALEDVRIEYIMGKKLEGTNDYFFDAVERINIKNKLNEQIIYKAKNEHFDINLLGFYWILRSKNCISKEDYVDVYEKVYNKYKDCFIEKLSSSSAKEILSFLKEIKDFFESLLPKKGEKNNYDSKVQNVFEESIKKQIKESAEEKKQSEKKELEDLINRIKDEKNKEQEEQAAEEDLKAEGDLSENDSDSDSGSSDSQSGDRDDDSNDFVESKQQTSDNDIDSKEKIIYFESNFNISKAENDLYGELSNYSEVKTEEAMKYFKSQKTIEIPIKEIHKQDFSNSKRKKNELNYLSVVKKNSKEISSFVMLLKSKFKNKNKNKFFNNKEEGVISNVDLYKILNKESNQVDIFSKVLKTIKPGSEFIFLLDFSGSMDGRKLLGLMESLIILNESLARINVPFSIYAFSSGKINEYMIKSSSVSMYKCINKIYNKNKEQIEGNSSSFSSIFLIKNSQEKQSKLLKSFLGSVFEFSSRSSRGSYFKSMIRETGAFGIGCGTEEFSSFSYVINRFSNLKNKNLIIINDGAFNRFHNEDSTYFCNNSDDALKDLFVKKTISLLSEKEITINSKDEFETIMNNSIGFMNLYLEKKHYTSYNYELLQSIKKDFLEISKMSFEDISKKEFLKKQNLDFLIDIKNNKMKIKISLKNNFQEDETIKKEYVFVDEKIRVIFKEEKITIPKFIFSLQEDLKLSKYDPRFFIKNKELHSYCTGYNFSSSYKNKSVQIYSRVVDELRKTWGGIYAIGIDSEEAVSYVGRKNFCSVKTSDICKTLLSEFKKIA